MSPASHELAEEFPEHVDQIHDLRGSDAHFAKLYESYHNANRAVHAAETDVKPTSDDHIVELRKKRMRLKDQVYAYLSGK
jgi:uncharacterized protein YdcH (DUF465 family)